MKASIKFKESHDHYPQKQNQNLLVRLKIPVSICNLPFISTITASSSSSSSSSYPSDLSFNLRTNSPSGPSLKLTYSPLTTAGAAPLSLTLKSGVGLFGSPDDSPLILSASFNLFSNKPNTTFSLQIHPQFGHFSLKKTALSAPSTPSVDGAGDAPPERVPFFRELPEERPLNDGFFSGVAVFARTVVPVGRRAAVKFRWGVNFPSDFGECKSFPFLNIDKISVGRFEEEVGPVVKKAPEKNGGGMEGDLEALKGMCGWIRRGVEDLKRENRDLRESLECLRLGSLRRNGMENETDVAGGKWSSSPSKRNSGDFDQRRSRRMGSEENEGRDVKKVAAVAGNGFEVSRNEMEEELKKAIQAASINGT